MLEPPVPEPHLPRSAVIFDLDGVLILSEAAHFQSWRTVAAARGVTLTAAVFKACFGRTSRDTVLVVLGELPPAEVQQIAAQTEQLWRDAIRGAVPVAPGALAVLQALRSAGHALALGSSAPSASVAVALNGTGLQALLPVVVDGSMVARGKPDPEVFRRCAEALGVAPVHCVVVEDAPAGLQAARAAGMRALGITSAHAAAVLRQAGADAVVDTLHQVTPGLVAELLATGTASPDQPR